ncbi:multivesicular body subunit 12-like Mvb12 isoform X2 [Rhodnius prolixus]|uniref:multivesicular body subunit 12-like Mvb12 isoform X2 n=1 Tax=Rhodnius prolixus TaxID=13249 RepID=UPI003D18B9F9
MMQQVFKSLPDDKPITAICIIEDLTKNPSGFTVVSRTHDQDSDADLWKGSTFFGGKISRYLCLSKTAGIGDYIVESIGVIAEKGPPPDGYVLVSRTIDTDAKAWKKRQICYRLTRRNVASSAVSDVILLSKSNQAPEGFELVGSINGLGVCIKKIQLKPILSTSPAPILGYSLNPNGVPLPGITSQKTNGIYPSAVVCKDSKPDKITASPSDEYVNLLVPQRPAPPVPSPQSNVQPLPRPNPPPRPPQPATCYYGTLTQHHGLEGIPFVLHPSLQLLCDKQPLISHLKSKTKEEIDKEYYYDFRLEREST